jgi:hypothetical protein
VSAALLLLPPEKAERVSHRAILGLFATAGGAGPVERAIEAAQAAGAQPRAARGRPIGRPLPEAQEIPADSRAVVGEPGRRLPPERREPSAGALGAKKIASLAVFAPRSGVYILDRAGIVPAVVPRPDTLHHRWRRLPDD